MITVECRAATWAQELDLLHDDLLSRLNEELGEARVKRLRMVVGDGGVPGGGQQRHDTVPIPGRAARPRKQDKGAHTG